MSCQQCSQFDREIKLSTDIEERNIKSLNKGHHCQQADMARKKYLEVRNKAVDNIKYNDLSMIIDAGGGAGCIHIPRFTTTEKGEPARHEMLKIKTTFVKVPYY